MISALKLINLQAALLAFVGESAEARQHAERGKRSHSVFAELQRWAFRARISKAKAEAGSPEWPVKAAARGSRSTGGEA